MRRSALTIFVYLICSVLFTTPQAPACTNILVSRGASADGSVMITYSADGGFLPRLLLVPARDFEPGAMEDVVGWEDYVVRGQVAAVAHSFAVVGLMNEHQVAIGETTTGGREELVNPDGLLNYDNLILLALKRATSAREAIMIMDELCGEYGYAGAGESFSVSDKNEVWLMEVIGKGPGVKGLNWVAARVPDGYITVHANNSRITTFPLDDPENWLYSKGIVEFAIEKGYYNPASGKPFSYRDAFHGSVDAMTKRVCDGRVWSVYCHAAPSAGFSADYFRGVAGAEDYPLFVKPDNKLSVHDVMQMMRDHFEGTPYDMTQGIDAGPWGSPYRWRGLRFELDGEAYTWERPISTMQAGFVMLAQSRNRLPDPVGGVYWFTPDDANTSCFLPLYCGITALPEQYAKGDFERMSLDSAWWMFNLVSNFTYDRYSAVIPCVREVQQEWEGRFLALQPAIDRTAAELMEKDEGLAREFLTRYSVGSGEGLFHRWQELGVLLFTKFKDYYVHEPGGASSMIKYPEEWLRRVLKEKGDQLKLPKE
jgi:dipeptidase